MATTMAALHRQRRQQKLVRNSILIGLQVLLAVIILIPFLWMFSVSIKPPMSRSPFRCVCGRRNHFRQLQSAFYRSSAAISSSHSIIVSV